MVIKVPIRYRVEGAGVSTVLTTHEVMTKLFKDHIELNDSTLPRWSRMLSTWDQATYVRAVLKLLSGRLNGELVNEH